VLAPVLTFWAPSVQHTVARTRPGRNQVETHAEQGETGLTSCPFLEGIPMGRPCRVCSQRQAIETLIAAGASDYEVGR
jgi:hypothetical protein